MADLERVFRIDMYPTEWLELTSHLNMDQTGMLITICNKIYARRGPIENDPAWIAGSKCSPRLARSLIEQLLKSGDIQLTSELKITQKRCERELNKRRNHFESSSKGGRTSAEKEREYKKDNDLDSSEGNEIQHSSYAYASTSPSIPSESLFGDAAPKVDLHAKRFDEFFNNFARQRRGDKKKARAAWDRQIKAGADPDEIMRGLSLYLTSRDVARGFACGAAVWLNNSRWNDQPVQNGATHDEPANNAPISARHAHHKARLAAHAEAREAFTRRGSDGDSENPGDGDRD